MLRRSIVSLALIASAFSSSGGQSLAQLPRATVATGMNDSTLVYVSDSAKRSRAAVALDFRKMLSLRAFDSLVTANLRLTSAVNGSATWANLQTFAANQRVDSATGATRAQKLTTARTIGGVSFDGTANILPDSAVGAARASALVGSPAITVSSCTGCGGGGATVSDTVRTVTFDSVRSVRARHDTISASAGASKPLTLQSWTSGSTRKNTLVLGADTSATFLGQIKGITGTVTLPSVTLGSSSIGLYRTASSPDTVALAWDGTSTGRILFGPGPFIGATGSPRVGGRGVSQGVTLTATASNGATVDAFRITRNALPGNTFLVGADTFQFSAFSDTRIIGPAGNLTIQAGTGASRTMTLQTTTSGSAIKNTLVLGADSTVTALGPFRAPPGTSTLPGLSFTGATNYGFYQSGTAVLAVTNGGVRFTFGDNAGGDNFSALALGIPAGTASKPGLNFTNSGGVNSGLRFGNNGSTDTLVTVVNGTDTRFNNATRDSLAIRAVFTGDTMRVTSKPRFTALTAASGTPNTVCIDATTKELTENAATSCVVSSLRFKTDVLTLSPTWATSKLMGLRPTSFTYRDGGRNALGLIAENADSVDSRLGFRNADGQINSYDQAGVLALLTSTVQELVRKTDRQGAMIDSLRLELAKVKKP